MCTRPQRRWNARIEVQGDTVEAMADTLRQLADQFMAKALAGEKFPRVDVNGEVNRNARAFVTKVNDAPQGAEYQQAVIDAYAAESGWDDDTEVEDDDDVAARLADDTVATVDPAIEAAIVADEASE